MTISFSGQWATIERSMKHPNKALAAFAVQAGHARNRILSRSYGTHDARNQRQTQSVMMRQG
jgi:hypothetical protein